MEQEIKKPKLSEMLRGIAQLILSGSYKATYATLIVQSISVLETIALAEEKKEADVEPKLEVVPEVVEEEVQTNE